MKGARLACMLWTFQGLCSAVSHGGLAFHALDMGATLNPRFWEIQIFISCSWLDSFPHFHFALEGC